MADNQKKSGGAKKIGRKDRRGRDTSLRAFIKGRISAEKYFKSHGLTTHFAYARKAFNLKK